MQSFKLTSFTAEEKALRELYERRRRGTSMHRTMDELEKEENCGHPLVSIYGTQSVFSIINKCSMGENLSSIKKGELFK